MTSVKFFHSAMPNAPVLSGTAGSLIAVLDACLADGFGLKTADSIVVSGGVATATFSTGHIFEPDTVMLVAGATPSGLNGEKRVLTTSTNTVTFSAAGIPDLTATGTITAKLAPAGWAKVFSATNLAAYRSLDAESTRMFLRVDDTGTTNARVVGYESMTDVNTGVGPFPTSIQIAGGGWWPKANGANATARTWTLVADSKGFWLHTHTNTASPGASGSVWGFGDFASLKSGDPYACQLFCAKSDIASSNTNSSHSVEYCNNVPVADSGYIPRSYTSLGGSVAGATCATSGWDAGAGSSGNLQNNAVPQYPNGPDNGLALSGKSVVEPGVCLRGRTRGIYLVVQKCHERFNWRDKIDGQGTLLGRKLVAIKCGGPAQTTSTGLVFVDITGPWS